MVSQYEDGPDLPTEEEYLRETSGFPNATPRPWTVANDEHPGVYKIIGHQGPVKLQPARAFGRDDAELIVRAVNAFEPLVVELTNARGIVEKWCHYQGNSDALFKEFLEPIDAALAKARGEQ
jgi:hypothetical protein